MGKVLESQEKRSLLPTGKSIRAAVWQRLRPMPPDVIDKLKLWQIGALLGNHLVEKDAAERAEADRIISESAARVIAVQEAERSKEKDSRR